MMLVHCVCDDDWPGGLAWKMEDCQGTLEEIQTMRQHYVIT